MKVVGLLASGVLEALAALAANPAAPGLVETVDRFEKLQVTDESAEVTNLRLSSAHLECVLATGRAAYVKAGGEIVGLFFEGGRTMEYVSVDLIEAPVVTYVTKKSSGLSPEKVDTGVRLKDRFTRLLWIALGEPVPQLAALGPRPLAGLFYDKGPLLLAALHRQLGDETFLTFLKSYQKSLRWKFGTTKLAESLLQFMTKKDFGPFFEENYWGLGMP